ncbi:hypothetical protein OG292_22410 [Streptomyces sp. NBC_01511]|uniref:hypothetical protein n=1 Tax=Streptomyces sp. NBC_01511 TaxID=2903889 RepID=UPI00386B9239
MKLATTIEKIATGPAGKLPFLVRETAPAIGQPPAPLPGTWTELATSDPEDRTFCAAVDAITAALATSTDPDGTWLALRSALNLTAGRDAITGEK